MILSFVEAFWIMAVMFAGPLPFLLLLRYSKPQRKPESVAAVPLAKSSKATEQPQEEEPEPEPELVLH